PISEIKNQIESVQKTGKIIRPYLGVRYAALTPELARRNNLATEYGAYITSIVEDSPASKAGLQEDDIIVKINGDELGERASLQSLLAKYKVGETVEITYIRGNKQQTLNLTLEQAPQQ